MYPCILDNWVSGLARYGSVLCALFVLGSCGNAVLEKNTKSEVDGAFFEESDALGEKAKDHSRIVILLLGDSLTYGYDLSDPKKNAYPGVATDLLSKKGYDITLISGPGDLETFLAKNRVKNYMQAVESHDITLINASVPAVLAEFGVQALKVALKFYEEAGITHVFIALGANDGLKLVSVRLINKFINDIIKEVKYQGMKPLLGGMKMPPSDKYVHFQRYDTAGFAAIFPSLAQKHNIPLWEFILKDVALKKKYNHGDKIHPNVEGHKIIGRHFASFLQKHVLDSR
ncbi:MAG: GDSL-type esterase/lipase family protein [Proteobacteria bacterium]|nr:GDSL-type esterase/lipase family protein [Pseudomonadota bacterium]